MSTSALAAPGHQLRPGGPLRCWVLMRERVEGGRVEKREGDRERYIAYKSRPRSGPLIALVHVVVKLKQERFLIKSISC